MVSLPFDWTIPTPELSHLSLLERVLDPQPQAPPSSLPFHPNVLICQFPLELFKSDAFQVSVLTSPSPFHLFTPRVTILNSNSTVILIKDYGKRHNLDKILALVTGCMGSDSYLTLFT